MTEEDRAGRAPQAPEKPKRFGILPQDFTRDLLTDVLGIYADVARGGKRLPDYFEKEAWFHIGDQLERHPYAEMRYGSALTLDSKLWVARQVGFEGDEVTRLLDFRFDANMSRNDASFERGQEMEGQFRNRMDEYLQERGIAHPVLSLY